MARYEFGGVMAAWVVSTVAGDGGIEIVTLPAAGTTLTIYDAPEGQVVTDFIDENGNPVTEITLPAGDPYIPRFQGPDGAEALWVQAANGRWLPLPRWNDGSEVGGSDPDAVKLSGGNVFEYADSQSPPWLVVRRPNDGTDSTQWSNLLEFQYWDNDSNRYRLGFHLNEKALLRVRGVTANDVAVRFMAHPNLIPQWPVMEVTRDNNTEKIFQVFERQVTSHVGVQVPFLVNPQGERLYFGTADPATDPAYADYRPNVGDVWLDFNGEA